MEIPEAQQEPEKQQGKQDDKPMEQLTDDKYSDMKVNALEAITLFTINRFV